MSDNKSFDRTKYGFNPAAIPHVCVLDFSRMGLRDNTDLMRIQIMGFDIQRIAENDIKNLTVDNIKKTSGFLSTVNNVNVSDEYLEELTGRIKAETKLFKTRGLGYYARAVNKRTACRMFIDNKIGVTCENLIEVEEVEGDATVFE